MRGEGANRTTQRYVRIGLPKKPTSIVVWYRAMSIMQRKNKTKTSKRDTRRNLLNRLESEKRVLGSLAVAVFWKARRLNFFEFDEFGLVGSATSLSELRFDNRPACFGLAGGVVLWGLVSMMHGLLQGPCPDPLLPMDLMRIEISPGGVG